MDLEDSKSQIVCIIQESMQRNGPKHTEFKEKEKLSLLKWPVESRAALS